MKLILAGLLFIILVVGCHSELQNQIPTEQLPPQQVLVRTVVKNMSTWQGICMAGVLLSFLGIMLGQVKIGVPVLATSLFGLGMTYAQIRYANLIAIICLVCGVGVCAYSIWLQRKKFQEVVAGGQKFKELNPDLKDKFAEAQNLVQSVFTKKAVKKVKGV